MGQTKKSIAHFIFFLKNKNTKVVIANELDAWPEKKLKSVGVFNIRIRELISSVLFGLNLATDILVKCVTRAIKSANPNTVKNLCSASFFEKLR